MTSSVSLARSLESAGFRGETAEEAPLSAHTTWRIGGPAELLATPVDAADLAAAIRWALAARVPWRVLGNGSNLLVRDEGVRGMVLRIRKTLDQVSFDGPRARAGAGAALPAVANLAAARGLAGIEFAAGIPGTLGGALVMNAGWHESEISAVVETVEYLDPAGPVRTLTASECGFGYRHSALRGRGGVILSAALLLRPDDPSAVKARLEKFASSRKANQPTEMPSCGSVFLKPKGDYAGRLIEAAGLKGFRVGDAQVSPKHANFIVNLGHATACDVLSLVERIESEVEARFGVRLEREFEIW
jgi:UDP-N-acetylmuramate dehydrogenase